MCAEIEEAGQCEVGDRLFRYGIFYRLLSFYHTHILNPSFFICAPFLLRHGIDKSSTAETATKSHSDASFLAAKRISLCGVSSLFPSEVSRVSSVVHVNNRRVLVVAGAM